MERGLIHVRIDQIAKTVNFIGANDSLAASRAREQLQEGLRATLAVSTYVTELDRRIARSDEYIQRVLATERADARSAAADPYEDDLDSPAERVMGGMRLA